MGILEKLRPQPRWKHADPAERARAVPEVPDEDRDVLRELATADPDARVRKAAVRRLTDPSLLAEIAAGDADLTVREQAAELLVDTAVGKYEDVDESVARAALGAVADVRHLVTIARASFFPGVRAAALAAVTDVRALGTIARQADHAGTRLDALGRIQDGAELAAVALRTDHKDVGLAAIERLVDRDALRSIADRARNKVVARRARAVVREAEDAEAAEARRRDERETVVRDLESLVRRGVWERARESVAELERRWTAVAAGAHDDLRRRFDAAMADLAAGLAVLARAEAERQREQEQGARLRTAAAALCDRVDALAAGEARAGVERARDEWQALSLPSDGFVDPRMRFERACRLALERHAAVEAAGARRAERDRIVQALEEVAALPDLADARTRWTALHARWTELGPPPAGDQDLVDRLAQADARIQARQAEAEAARAHELQEKLARVSGECDRLAAAAGAESLSLADAERTLREARALADDVPVLPTRQHRDDIVRRLRDVQAALTPRIQELRELSDWQRWANAGLLEKLCAEMEAVSAVQEPPEIARRLRSLEDRWKQIGPAPRDRAQDLWTRFRTARDAARSRCEDYLRQEAAERAANLARKEVLVARAEALADSTDWVKTAQELQQLQAEWKTIGPVSRGQEKTVWQRFRAACDRFFTRRHEDLARRKQAWSANLARKEALCARAVELAASTDWDAAAAELRRLQAEWKGVGPVRRSKSEALWQRFRAACDGFFQRYAERDQIEFSARLAEREALVQELETLVTGSPSAPGEREGPGEAVSADAQEIFRRAGSVWRRWSDAERARPLPPAHGNPLRDRLVAALTKAAAAWPASFQKTPLDPDANRRAMDDLCAKVERLTGKGDAAGDTAATPAMRLAAALREALAANTIGGRVDEEAEWRAAVGEVRAAQSAWQRIGPVPADVARPLTHRFERACRAFFNKRPQTATPKR